MSLYYPQQNQRVSQPSWGIFSLLGRVTADLVIGKLVAGASENLFDRQWTDLMDSKETDDSNLVITKKFVRVWLQLAFTTLLAVEARGLYTDEDSDVDPTGGMFFMMSLEKMPKFWNRVDQLFLSLKQRLLVDIGNYSNPIEPNAPSS